MEKFKTALIVLACIFIGLTISLLAFRIAMYGAIIALVVAFGLIGYVIAKLLYRRK